MVKKREAHDSQSPVSKHKLDVPATLMTPSPRVISQSWLGAAPQGRLATRLPSMSLPEPSGMTVKHWAPPPSVPGWTRWAVTALLVWMWVGAARASAGRRRAVRVESIVALVGWLSGGEGRLDGVFSGRDWRAQRRWRRKGRGRWVKERVSFIPFLDCPSTCQLLLFCCLSLSSGRWAKKGDRRDQS